MTLKEYIEFLQEYNHITDIDKLQVQFTIDGKSIDIDNVNMFIENNKFIVSCWNDETVDIGRDEFFTELCQQLDTDSEILDASFINKQMGRI